MKALIAGVIAGVVLINCCAANESTNAAPVAGKAKTLTSVEALQRLLEGNARYVAGGIPIAPAAQLNDGLADIIIVPAASMLELAVLGPQILLGSHLGSELVLFRRVRKISVRSEPGMWFNVDGELMSNAPAHFEVLPRAIKVVVGPPPNSVTAQ